MSESAKKAVPIILLCCVIGFVILMEVAIYNLVQTKNYQKVKAEISSVKTELYEGSGDSQTGKAHFVTYKFTYGGKPYEVTQQIFTKIGKHVGDVVTLRCNPDNPAQIANTLVINSCFAISGFLCFFFIVVYYQNYRRR